MDMLSYKYENGSITINKSHFTEKKMPRSFLVKSKKSYNVHRPIDTEQSEQKVPDPAPKTSKWHYYISEMLNLY